MDIEEKDLLSQFSAYVKVAIKHTRQEYLKKREKIRSYEMPFFEDEEPAGVEEEDILQQIDLMSDSLERGIIEIRLLLNQIDNSVLFQTVSGLTKQQKEVMVLRIFYMKTFGEIGIMLGITPKKAENTYFNAIKKVRKIIGGGQNGI